MKLHALTQLLQDVLETARAAPGRLAVMCLAMMLGSASLTILLATTSGLNRQARNIVRDLGANVFAIMDAGGQRAGTLREKHVELLRANLADCLVSAVRIHETPMPEAGASLSVLRADEHLAQVRQWRLRQGRFLDAGDIRDRSRHAVASADLAARLNLAVGQVVWVERKPYEVVGILKAGLALAPDDQAVEGRLPRRLALFIPATIPPHWLTSPAARDTVDAVFVSSSDERALARNLRLSQRLLDLPGLAGNALVWLTPDYLLQRIQRLRRIIALTAGSITMLCLVMGGTILLSVMIGNVRERVPEIGLRRALGATPAAAALLFVAEAVLMTSLAGGAASLLATLALLAARSHLPMPIAFSFWTVVGPTLAATLVAIASAYVPARAAARVSPSEALRND